MPRKKLTLQPDVYAIVQRAVEEGLLGGWHRAHKHTGTPTMETLLEEQERYVMLALEEVIRFPEVAL